MPENAYQRGLVWLRNDLRMDDNTALYRAAKGCNAFAALFIACPETWRSHGDGDNVVAMRLRTLKRLQASLAKKHIPLYFLELPGFAQVPAALQQICRKLEANAVFANAEYPLNEQRRDLAVREALQQIRVPVEYCTDRTLIPPGSLATNSGEGYKVFTPFKRAFIALHDNGDRGFDPLPAPRSLGPDHGKLWPEWITLDTDNNLARSIPYRVGGYGVAPGGDRKVLDWVVGESAAKKQLEEFSALIHDYLEFRVSRSKK